MVQSNGNFILVTGAGGFIGHHLVKYLKAHGHRVRGVDLKRPQFEPTAADEFELLDLRDPDACLRATQGVDQVYQLAADMGGMGYLFNHQAQVLRNNSLINLNMLEAARLNGAQRYLFTSSAAVYPDCSPDGAEARPLKESDAYPAQPSDAYGWEKLNTERLCQHYAQDYGLDTRLVRLHNIYGPLDTWHGGRERVPTALCRKVATAKLNRKTAIEVWGDGEQTRSFCYVDDCVEGLYRLMESDFPGPVNIGQDRLVSINQLVQLVSAAADYDVTINHVEGPQGARGRSCDNTLLRAQLGWEPCTPLEEGIRRTYEWVESQVYASARSKLVA
jgi:GDP-D-mannose 3', 5'-epimerase